jgi:hypothetical protein
MYITRKNPLLVWIPSENYSCLSLNYIYSSSLASCDLALASHLTSRQYTELYSLAFLLSLACSLRYDS